MRTKALCVLSRLLGKDAVINGLTGTLAQIPGIDPVCVFISGSDYDAYQVPWWARYGDAPIVQYIATKKTRTALNDRYGLLIVNSWEFVVAFRHVAATIPAVALLDAVPQTMHQRLLERGMGGWKRQLAHAINDRAFGRAAREFDVFLPKGSDCALSLQRDYGVSPHNCHVTLAPLDLRKWLPRSTGQVSTSRLLFVGNDFARKGGNFLLQLFESHLARTCSLTIASNDPLLESRALPAGVRWLRGKTRDEMVEVYQACDLFIFPSRQDFTPGAVAEALACGIPCIGEDIEGLQDLVRNGETGYLMPRGSSMQAWATRILSLLEDRDELDRMSRACRLFAEEHLDLQRFQALVQHIVRELLVVTQRNDGVAAC